MKLKAGLLESLKSLMNIPLLSFSLCDDDQHVDVIKPGIRWGKKAIACFDLSMRTKASGL